MRPILRWPIAWRWSNARVRPPAKSMRAAMTSRAYGSRTESRCASANRTTGTGRSSGVKVGESTREAPAATTASTSVTSAPIDGVAVTMPWRWRATSTRLRTSSCQCSGRAGAQTATSGWTTGSSSVERE